MNFNIKKTGQPRIVIIGGGFAGLELAKRLRKKPYQIVLFDRHNYHTFQPLLYQVATGGLRVDSIAYPLRKVFHKASNVSFRMEEVTHIEPSEKWVQTKYGRMDFDYLVIATGSQSNFFNFSSIRELLMPLKNPQDALRLRSFVLQNFEKAISSHDAGEQEELINIAIVGGGPTGVELAGALAEMKRFVFPKDYPGLDVERMRITLFEAAPKLLGGMSEKASEHALKYLKEFGVEVHLNEMVAAYDGSKLTTKNGTSLRTDTVIWTAGVKGDFPAGFDARAIAPGNRLKVDAFNRVDGFEQVFALGDAAAMIDENNPKGHPMLATVAVQQGQYLADNFLRMQKNKPLQPFRFKDKGTMATIGRNRAVVDLPSWKFQGMFAWFVWIFVHIFLLVGFKNKITALWDWVYNFLTYDRAVRLIINPFERKEKLKNEAAGNGAGEKAGV